MKILILTINDYVDEKINIILNWALKNNVTDIKMLSNGFNKEKLMLLKDKIANINTTIKFFLDYKDSYKLSGKDIKECTYGRDDLFVEVSFSEKFNINNKNIYIMNNLYRDIDFLNILENEKNYNIFICKNDKFIFDFQLNLSMKSVFVGVPYLNTSNDFVVLETKNNRIDGYHLIIDNDVVKEEVLFKI